MAFRLLNGAMQGKYACILPTNSVTTNYIPVSTDAGMIIMASSNLGHAMAATNQNTATYGSDQYLGIFVKPEYENDESSCSTAGSTSCKLWFQPIVKGDILEVDYTTATYSSGNTGELHSTSIGMFYRTGFSSNSSTPAVTALGRSYLNVTTGVNVVENTTGAVFKLIDYTTENKTAVVQYLPADLCS